MDREPALEFAPVGFEGGEAGEAEGREVGEGAGAVEERISICEMTMSRRPLDLSRAIASTSHVAPIVFGNCSTVNEVVAADYAT